jgi:hypothetical protein
VFRKVTQEIFLELDKMKAKVPIYLIRRWDSRGEMEMDQEAAAP